MQRKVIAEADKYLATMTPMIMQRFLMQEGKPMHENIGTILTRNVFHYWYHTGKASAVRQMLGHVNIHEFEGDMSVVAYKPEGGQLP